MADGPYRVGDVVEVNLSGVTPLAVTDVLLDPDHDVWHLAKVTEVLPDGTYQLQIMPLVGAIEAPPVGAERLRLRS